MDVETAMTRLQDLELGIVIKVRTALVLFKKPPGLVDEANLRKLAVPLITYSDIFLAQPLEATLAPCNPFRELGLMPESAENIRPSPASPQPLLKKGKTYEARGNRKRPQPVAGPSGSPPKSASFGFDSDGIDSNALPDDAVMASQMSTGVGGFFSCEAEEVTEFTEDIFRCFSQKS